jgi:hypothetical protein
MWVNAQKCLYSVNSIINKLRFQAVPKKRALLTEGSLYLFI